MASREKIVVVDDNRETLEIISMMCQGAMNLAEVHSFTGAEAAIAFMREESHVSLVLCDWNMPEKTGLDLLRELRASGNFVPFVMVTARSDLESVLNARKFGVDLYISKPFSIAELQDKIRWVTSPDRRLPDIALSDTVFSS